MKILFSFLLLLLSLQGFATDGVFLKKSFKSTEISSHIKSHPDTVLACDIDRAILLQNWIKVNPEGFSKPYTEDAYWLKFQVRSDSSRFVYLENRYKLLEEYRLFVLENDSIIYTEDLGYITGGVTNKTSFAPSFKFWLKKGLKYDCYIFLNKTFSSSVLPFKIYAESAYQEKVNDDFLNKGLVIGILLFMFLSGISSFLVFRDKVFIYYVAYLVGLATMSFMANGIARYYVWGENNVLSTFGNYIGCAFGLWFLGKIIFEKLNGKIEFKAYHTLFKLVSYLIWALLIIAILMFSCMEKPPLTFFRFSIPLCLVYPILFLVVCLKSYVRHKKRIALWLVFIFSITLVYAVLFSFITFVRVNYSHIFNFNFLIIFEGISVLVVLNLDLFRAKQQQIALQNALIIEKEKSNLNFINGQHSERKTISQKLHDSSANKINYLKKYIAKEYKDDKAKDLLEELHFEVRNISHELNPYGLKENGLKSAMEAEIFKLDDLYPDVTIKLHFDANRNSLIEASELSNVFYWTFTELVANALKYSKADLIEIEIIQSNKNMTLSVIDNGIGYNLDHKSFNLGIRSIKERARLLGGEFIAKVNELNTAHTFTIPF